MNKIKSVQLTDVYDNQKKSTLILWDILCERSVENDPNVNISHRKLPDFADHEAFVAGRPFHKWYLLYSIDMPGVCFGYVNITPRNEIGIILYRDSRGAGIGKLALQALLAQERPLPEIKSNRPPYFVANINPGNERSISLFEGLGFELVQQTFALKDAA